MEVEIINRSIYGENDTLSERASGTINGHEVQVIHDIDPASDTSLVKVDDSIAIVRNDDVTTHINSRIS
jgi:hypothetical protein